MPTGADTSYVDAGPINMDDPLSTDAPPGSSPPPAAEEPRKKSHKAKPGGPASVRAEGKEIEQKLAALLKRPGIPMRMAGDEWPAEHVEQNAQPLAKAIARRAEEDEKLRAQLLKLLRVGDSAGLVIAALTYLVPVLLYYGVIPAPPIVREQLAVPNRADVKRESIPEAMARERYEAARAQFEAAVASQHASDPPLAQSPPENTVGAQAEAQGPTTA